MIHNHLFVKMILLSNIMSASCQRKQLSKFGNNLEGYNTYIKAIINLFCTVYFPLFRNQQKKRDDPLLFVVGDPGNIGVAVQKSNRSGLVCVGGRLVCW